MLQKLNLKNLTLNKIQKYIVLLNILTIPIMLFIVEWLILGACCGIMGGLMNVSYGYYSEFSTFTAFSLWFLLTILLIDKHLKMINEDINEKSS